MRTQPIRHHRTLVHAYITPAGSHMYIKMDHVRISVQHTNTHTHTHIYIYMHVHGYMYRTSPPRGRTYTRGPAQSECLHVCARARASAVPPSTTGRAAFEAPPSASAVVRAAGPGAAHTEANEVTRAVFHAPMSALKADAE
jgi:hypothetical protein